MMTLFREYTRTACHTSQRLRRVKIPLLMLLICFVASPASAEWIAEVYGGGASTNKSDSLQSPGATATLHNLKFDTSGEVGGKVGYWLNGLHEMGAIGAGMDVFYFRTNLGQQTVLGTGNGVSVLDTLTPINASVTTIAFDVFKLRLHLLQSEKFPLGQVQPMVSVGPALFLTSATPTSTNQNSKNTNVGFKAGAGAHVFLAEMVSLFGEYRFTHVVNDLTFGQAIAATTRNTHHLIGGVSLHF